MYSLCLYKEVTDQYGFTLKTTAKEGQTYDVYGTPLASRYAFTVALEFQCGAQGSEVFSIVLRMGRDR